jgi:GNAT superfamily N-acetyltransferase
MSDAGHSTRGGPEEAHVGPPVIRAAGREDVPLLLELFMELAEYEHLTHEMRATAELLDRALFGEHPAAEALIALRGSEVAGYALFFPTFSSFLAVQGVWLEDLFVRPAHRRGGVGKALLAAVAARVRERGGERLEWSALTWNELALGFYRGLGAQTMDEWITHRLIGEDLTRLAAAASDRASS